MAVADADPWSVTEKTVRAAMRSPQSPAAVATVAAVDGSAYRRPGAKLVVSERGATQGAVTAGCLERAVVDLCESVIERGAARTERFDLTDDDTWGLGLGCNGVIDLFVEPLDASWEPALDALGARSPVTVVTVVDADTTAAVGRRVVVDSDGIRPVPGRDRVGTETLETARETIDNVTGTARTQTVEAEGTTLLIDGLEPVPELLLFGSQADLTPMVRFADQVGFRVTVHAARGGVSDGDFPRAETVRTGHPSTVAEGVDDRYTYAVVMSHNLIDDRLAVRTLLKETAVPYVGLMGPRERFEELREGLRQDGTTLTRAELDRVATPVGLSLGGGDPAEVALSVVSEVLAVSNGCSGERLRDRTGPIHSAASGR